MANKHTKSMMSMLPQWMKMAKDEQSVGAKFLDAFGMEISDIELYLNQLWENMYIGTANLQTADYCYKIPLALNDVVDYREDSEIAPLVRLIIAGERVESAPASTLRDFLSSDDNTYMIDREEGYLYVKIEDHLMEEDIFHPVDAIDIGSATHYEYMLHHIWNCFDEFGMLLGIYRLPGERNEAFKNRIIDVFKNPGGAHEQGIIYGISRELGLEQNEVNVGALADDTYVKSTLINPDGTPTEKYIDYVNQINANLGFSWDHMNWGEAYWRSIEENNMGFHYLPHVWDGFFSGWKDHEVQSGIGSGDDLLVYAPIEESAVRKFKAFVGLHGTEERIEEHDPELRFKYKIVAKGKIPNDEYDLEQYHYTVSASEIVKLHFLLTASRHFLFRTNIDWDPSGKYNWVPDNIDIITGETALHTATHRYVKLYVDMKTADRKVTPALEKLTVNWIDTNNQKQQFVMDTDDDFSHHDTDWTTEFLDTEVVNGSVTLAKGSFAAVIDTYGAFNKSDEYRNIRINRTGSICLDLPTV